MSRNGLQMICAVCAAEFRGRADAVYCSSRCRQKSYRDRLKMDERVVRPYDPSDVGDELRQLEDINFLTLFGNTVLTPERLNNYAPQVKVFMAGALRRLLRAVEESSARDLANGSITAAAHRRAERKAANKFGP